MHRCLTVQDWIKLWGDPGTESHRLSACPDCWPLHHDGPVWLEAVGSCDDCRSALETALLSEDLLNCPGCMESFAKLHELLEDLDHFDPVVASEVLLAGDLAAKLERKPLAARIARVTDDPSYQQWALAQHLLKSARSLWASEPELAHEHAAVAAAVADLLDPESYHPLWVADLRAKAHAYLANTHRTLAEFHEAEREFLAAESFVRLGTGSGQSRTVVLSLKASLLIDQRRFEEASLLLEAVLGFYEAAEDAEQTARTCLKLALVAEAKEDYAAAAALCARAESYLDPGTHPRLWALAKQNAVWHRVEAGEIGPARELFDALPPAVDRAMELRRLWIEGNLLRAEGETGAARVAYSAARRGFVADGLHYHGALVSLEEAVLALDEGEHADAQSAAQEASILLIRGAARQEAIVALRVLLTAMERGVADQALVLALARRIAALKPST